MGSGASCLSTDRRQSLCLQLRRSHSLTHGITAPWRNWAPTLLVAVLQSSPAISLQGVVAAPECLAAPCPHYGPGASAFSGMLRPARQQPRLSTSQGQPRRLGLLRTGLNVKGKAFYEHLKLRNLGVNVFEMISKAKRNVAGCCELPGIEHSRKRGFAPHRIKLEAKQNPHNPHALFWRFEHPLGRHARQETRR